MYRCFKIEIVKVAQNSINKEKNYWFSQNESHLAITFFIISQMIGFKKLLIL